MYKPWTDVERLDAQEERQNRQPYEVIATLLNKKYHNGQPVRSCSGVRAQLKKLIPPAEKPNPSQPTKPKGETIIPQVIAQIVLEETMPEGMALNEELAKLIANPPKEPEKIRKPEDTELSDAQIDEIMHKTAELQPFYQQASGIVRAPTIEIPETGWFGIVFSSDWHIGNIWTQLLTVLYEAQIIAATPGMYVFLGGDSVDGGVPAAPHGGILNEQIMPAHMQRACSKRICRLLSPKMKAAATGCHEWWTMDAADYDFIHDAIKGSGCAYLGGGNKYKLEAEGGGSWNGCYHHKAQGHSQYNVFHPCVRRALFHEQESDIICVAHQHLSGTTRQVLGERLRYMARTGARKNFDKYASKLGSDEARDDLDVPVLLLHGTLGRQVKGQWIEGIPMAATVLSFLRQADPYKSLTA